MGVTIKITDDLGHVKEVTRILEINSEHNLIKELERELGFLSQAVNSTVFERALSVAQLRYSEEKKVFDRKV